MHGNTLHSLFNFVYIMIWPMQNGLGGGGRMLTNLTYLIFRHQNVSSCQISMDKTLFGEILHT